MAFSSGATFVIQFATTVVLARVFTPAEFGLITSILVLASYGDVLWQAGVGQAIIQKEHVSDDDFATAHRLTVALGLLAGVLLAAAASPMGSLLGVDPILLIVVALIFPLNAVGSVPLAMVQRRLRFRVVLSKDLLEAATYGVVGMATGLMGAGLEGLVLAVVAKTAIGALLPWCYAHTPAGASFRFSIARQLLKFGVGVSLSSLLNTTARNADYIVVLRTMDAVALGLYSRAYQLVTIPANIFGQVIDRVLFPTLSRLQTDRAALGRVYVTTTAMLAAIYFPGGVLLYFLSEDIVILLLGDDWRPVAEPLRALALFLFCRVGYKVGEPIAKALGAVYSNAVLQGAYTVFVFVCALIGSAFGLVGVALGVGIALVLNYLAVSVYVYTLVRFSIPRILLALAIPLATQVGGFLASERALAYLASGTVGASRQVWEVTSIVLIQVAVFGATVVLWPRSMREAVIRYLTIRRTTSSQGE